MRPRTLILVAAGVIAAVLGVLLLVSPEPGTSNPSDSRLPVVAPEQGGSAPSASGRAAKAAEPAPPPRLSQGVARSRAPILKPLPPLEEMKRVGPGELAKLGPGLARRFQAELGKATSEPVGDCVQDFRRRRAGRDAGVARIEHTVLLSVSAREGEAVVRAAEGDEGWPATMDEPLQKCLVSAYTHAVFEADRDYDFQVEWPLVIR